jgi:Restriction endonuclease
VELGPYSRDGGIDIFMEKISDRGDLIKIGIECKHINGNVGRPIIQKLHSAALRYRLNEAWVVTTRDFSKDAYEYVHTINNELKGPRMKLINGNTLRKMDQKSKARSNHVQSDDPNIIIMTFVIIVAYIIWKYVCLRG